MGHLRGGELVPFAAVEQTAGGLLADALEEPVSGFGDLDTVDDPAADRTMLPPLLEMEGNPLCPALVTKRTRPFDVHRPGTGAALTAHDDPIDARPILDPTTTITGHDEH